MAQSAQAEVVVAEHESGIVTLPEDLNQLIQEAWGTLLAKPGKKAEIARELGVAESQLTETSPPFEVKSGPSGVLETVVIILLAKGFVGGVGAAAGRATFDYMLKLWTETSEPLQDPKKPAIGEKIERKVSQPPAQETGTTAGGETKPTP